MGTIAWWGIIRASWPVLSLLAIMSILTLAVALEKWKTFKIIHVDSGPFLESIRRSNDPAKIIQWCEKSDQPLAHLTQAIYKAPGTRPDRDRVMDRTIQILVHKLEIHIAVLGTIAGVAPFVGLLGTVMGIIKSFRAVSMTSMGGAGVVAMGIAEALVGTAAGLVVAIPALIAYNYFVNKMRRFVQSWEIAGSEIIDLSLGGR